MFVRFSGRLLINVASLNTQGASGTNYIEITKVPVVLEKDGTLLVEEVPAISGNMMKHYHFVHLVELLKESRYNKDKLSKDDLKHVAYRFREKIDKEKNIKGDEAKLSDEEDILKKFATADIHGYLAPKTQNRRESLIKFSFVIPCEETVREAVDISAVTQNRVVIDDKGNIEGGGREEGKAMMIFKRQYASALYGFASAFDAYYVGRPLSNPTTPAIGNNERKERAKLSILAYINLLGGIFGANTSRGLPALEVRELIAVVSDKPVPMAKHGFYSDYVEETIRIMNDFAETFNIKPKIFVYKKNGIDMEDCKKKYQKVEIEKCDSYIDLINRVASEVENGIK